MPTGRSSTLSWTSKGSNPETSPAPATSAETTVRYRAPVLFEDALHAAASIRTIGNRSYVMVFELRAGLPFEEGVVAEGSAAHVFYNLEKGEVKPRPDWFLSTAAELEGRLEESFALKGGR